MILLLWIQSWEYSYHQQKELNMDIIKSLPDFIIDDYIGKAGHQYKDDYPDLLNLRKYVFGRYNLNIYEYINIIKYIDKSLFETIKQMIPARAKGDGWFTY